MFNRRKNNDSHNFQFILDNAINEAMKSFFCTAPGYYEAHNNERIILNITSGISIPYIEIYYANYLKHMRGGEFALATIFENAVKKCLDAGDRFSPEFCNQYPSCKEEFKTSSSLCVIS